MRPPVVIGEYSSLGRRSRIVLALVVLLLGPVVGVIGFPDRGQAPIWSWVAFVMAFVISSVYAGRMIRVGYTVTPRWIECRGLCTTRRYPPRSIHRLGPSSLFVFVEGTRVHLPEADPKREPGTTLGFRRALKMLATRPIPTTEPQENNDRHTLPQGLAGLFAVGFVVSVMAYASASADEAYYRSRAARDRVATADVLDWQVRDQGDWYSTEVEVRFVGHDGGTTETELHLDAEHREAREVIDIVYDPRHPTDADFASRPNRSWQEDTAPSNRAAAKGCAVTCLLGLGLALATARRVRHEQTVLEGG